MPFLEALFEGLLDAQSQSSSGSCVVLNAVLKARGPEVHSQVAYILACLQQKLLQMEHPQAKTGTYRAIRTLTSHHMLPALDALFDRQLPVFPLVWFHGLSYKDFVIYLREHWDTVKMDQSYMFEKVDLKE